MFFKEVSSAQKACIYLFQSRPTAKQYIFKITVVCLNIFKNVIYYDFKAEFSASLLQSHSPSEIILIFRFASKKNTCIITMMLKTCM